MSVYRVGTNKSSTNVFPSVRPTLDLDFANSKTLDPRITFTRSSGGSYVGADGLIKYAGVNEPRFDHDPTTGESLGLLIEESRQNFISQSETFSGWGAIDIIPSLDNSIINPTGNGGVRKIIENLGNINNQKVIFFDATVGNNNQFFSHSFFVKPIGNRNVQLNIHNIGSPAAGFSIHYDIKNKNFFNITTTQGCILSSYGAIEYPNGWYKIYATANTTSNNSSGTQLRFHIRILDDTINKNTVYNGDGVSGLYIWGAQLEQGAFPTSYIPTQGSTRTRAADDVQITGKNFSEWYNKNEGTVYCNWKMIDGNNVQPPPVGINLVWTLGENLSGGAVTKVLSLQARKRETEIRFWQSTVEGQTFGESKILQSNNTFGKASVTYGGNKTASAVANNLQILNMNLPILTTDFKQLEIGSYLYNLNGTITRLTYWPKRLSNEQLIALTR